MKFTFKTEKATGTYRSFQPDHHIIKMNKIQVGCITDRDWRIRLMVYKTDLMEDGNPNCSWRWITLKKRSESLDEAKKWLNKCADEITRIHRLVCFEEPNHLGVNKTKK